jgi:hypothetical protein
LSTWLPERFLLDTSAAATLGSMNAQYLMLIEQLVRDGRSQAEIDAIVGRLVEEDVEVLEDELDDLPAAA